MEQSATEVAHDQRRVVLLQPRNGVVAGGAVAQGNLRLLATKKTPEAGLSLIAAFSETSSRGLDIERAGIRIFWNGPLSAVPITKKGEASTKKNIAYLEGEQREHITIDFGTRSTLYDESATTRRDLPVRLFQALRPNHSFIFKISI